MSSPHTMIPTLTKEDHVILRDYFITTHTITELVNQLIHATPFDQQKTLVNRLKSLSSTK